MIWLMRVHGAAGSDLLQFETAETLQDDLRMTPFAARKALSFGEEACKRTACGLWLLFTAVAAVSAHAIAA